MVPRFAPALQPLAEDPAIGATSSIPTPYPPDGAIAFVRQTMARRARGEEHAFAILLGDEVAGACGLAKVKDGSAELGYWVGKRFWGRGLATAAARLALGYAFTRLRLEEVYAHCLERNVASSRVLTNAGMRHVGGGFMPRSKWPTEPVFRFALTREEWKAISPPAAPRGRSRRRA
jgi:8-oxo-dGTP diphosphatase